MKLWNGQTGAELVTLIGHEDGVLSVAFSNDGRRLASGSLDNTVRVWELTGGTEVMRLVTGYETGAASVTFSPDGKRIASGGDRTAKVWDAATGAELMTLHGHRDMLSSVAFSPDGGRIATCERLGAAKLWDSTTGAEMLALRVDLQVEEGLSAVTFSPDGMAVAVGTRAGGLILWESAGRAGSNGARRNAESARRLVEKLYRKHGFYHDVTGYVQSDTTIDPDVRRMASRMADSRKWEDGDKLMKQAREIATAPDRPIEEYQAALKKADKANGLEPNDPGVLTALGAAQYRLGLHEDAMKTLTESARILSDAGEEPDPVNVAFTGITLHRIGRLDAARAALELLRELCKEEESLAWDMEVQALLAEAEGLIEGGKP